MKTVFVFQAKLGKMDVRTFDFVESLFLLKKIQKESDYIVSAKLL